MGVRAWQFESFSMRVPNMSDDSYYDFTHKAKEHMIHFSKLIANLKLGAAAIRLVRDTSELNRVFDIADTLATSDTVIYQRMADHVRQTPHGAAALSERPRLGRINIDALLKTAPGTLGHALGRYFVDQKLDPAALPTREAHDELAYVMAHLYETHDLWHVATGFETDVAGELGLQAFYAAQLPSKLPVALLTIGLLNAFLYEFNDSGRRLEAIARGWALGRRAKSLFGVRWAEQLNTPLEVIRQELGLSDTVASAAQAA